MPVAIIGAGILGSCTALELADRGHQVVLFERNFEPLSEASLYNEGKLHLGFVYAADRSFRTAERMIRGAVRFMDVLERWVPSRVLSSLPARPFDYTVHRGSMVGVEEIEAHFGRVQQALQAHPGEPRCRDTARPVWRRLSPAELETRYNPELIEAAYDTCEIAVDSWAVAAALRTALRGHPRIDLRTGNRVVTVRDRVGGGFDIHVQTDDSRTEGPFRAVVNASWANRPALDARYGLPHPSRWINRRKLGVNFQCERIPQTLPSFTIMLGTYGDVVVYRSGRVYLSWYPVCMVGTSMAAEETDWNEELAQVDLQEVERGTIEALARICPAVGDLPEVAAPEVVVNGGSIFALGESDIDDPASRLHERLDTGIEGQGGYFSVDTAKYTLGPAIAVRLAERVEAAVRRPAVA